MFEFVHLMTIGQHLDESVVADQRPQIGERGADRRRPVGRWSVERELLGGVDETVRFRFAQEGGHPARGDAERRIGGDLVVGRALDPGSKRVDLPRPDQPGTMPERYPAGEREVAAALRVVQRLVDGAVFEVPDRCSVQQRVPFGGADPFELVVEEFTEQVVKPIPPALVVERHDEQVDPVQPIEEFVRTVLSKHGITELGVEPPEQGDSHEERTNLVGLLGEDLLDQVVGDLSPAARGDEGRR